MSSPAADRNLLFGILALQLDFISRDQLVAAMNAWVIDKHKPLGAILQEQGALIAEHHDLLTAMVQAHLKNHDNDPEKSLAAVPVSSWLKEQIRSLCHPDVQTTLLHLDPNSTVSYAVGDPTSGGLRFQILRPHAEGGLGKVSVALDSELHREVALKEIKEKHADNSGSRSRFLVEAEITGGLEHPGIVPVYGLGHHNDGRPFYAMRFIRGDSLKDAIANYHRRASGPLAHSSDRASEPLALRFRQLLGRFVDVCNAIAYAHSRGVLHRDLKPGNIMLGKYGETLVVDWGLAKAAGRAESRERPGDSEPPLHPASASNLHETVAGTAIGTPTFMPPEQAAGRLDLLGPHSDIYSLGATLYMLLFNRVPIHGADTGEVLRKVIAGDIEWHRNPVSPRNRVSVPQPLVAICKKAMALQPQDRYATPLDLAGDIEHWLADEPVIAYREPWPARAGRWMRKHRTLVSSAAAVLIVATISSIVASALLTAKNTELANAYAAEQKASTQAKAEAALSTAVKDFLKFDLLQLASAHAQHREQQRGGLTTDPDLKVRDLVLRAANKIEGKFPDRPLVEAEIRWTLGWTLADIGRRKEALTQYLRIREIYAAELGPDHSDTLASMHNLANCYYAVGRTHEALELREETLLLSTVKLGFDHPDTLMSMRNLANSHRAAGHTQKALKLHQEALKLSKAKLGSDNPETLSCMSNLASSYRAAGHIQNALELHEESLQRRQIKLGPYHPDTLTNMNDLANSYAAVGRTQDATKLLEETLPLMQAKLGLNHPHTRRCMNNLANSYTAADRTQEALKLHEETLQLTRPELDPDDPDALRTMDDLANSYAAAGRTLKALKLHEETLQLRKAKLGPDHPDTLKNMNELANSIAAAGRPRDATKLFEETLPLMQAKLGPDHPDTLRSMHGLASSYAVTGQTHIAMKLLEETLPLMKAKLGSDHPDTLRAMNNLANSYANSSRTQDALKLREETLPLMQAKLGPDHADTLRAMNNLASSYAVAGLAKKSMSLHQETLRLRKAKLGADHPQTLDSMNNLADSYISQKATPEALALLRDALGLRQLRAQADPKNSVEQSFLAWTHGQLGQAEQLHHDYVAAARSCGKSVELFDQLDRAGVLRHPFFRDRMEFYRQQLALCQKAERAVNDLDFALQQPAAEVPGLLDMRVRYLLKEEKLEAAVETAAKWRERAAKADELYDAACLYALCAAAKHPAADAARLAKVGLAKECAEHAMDLLQRAVFKGFTNVAHMKQDRDLDALRDRADFQKLTAQLEAAKKGD